MMKKFKHHINSLFLVVCYYIIISVVNWNLLAVNWSEPSQTMFGILSVATIIIIQIENKNGQIN